MKKILTISEPYCGAKPTGYAVEIPNDNQETLAMEIQRGLVKGWYFNEVMAKSAIIDEDLDALKEQGYTYIPGDGVDEKLCGAAQGRFLVEVTIMDEREDGYSNYYIYSPFARLMVSCDVEWDYDEGEMPPDRHFEVTFTPEELEKFGVLEKVDNEAFDWILYEGRLDEFMSEYLTNFTDFCHKGFSMAVKPIRK